MDITAREGATESDYGGKDISPECREGQSAITEESLLEASGWASPAELNQNHLGWMVEVPEAAVPQRLHRQAAECAEEVAQVWGMSPITLRWYRATRDRAVAEAQWRRTKRAFARAGIARLPVLHAETIDVNGFAHGRATEKMLADSPREDILQTVDPVAPDDIPEEVSPNDTLGHPVIYLSADPHSFAPLRRLMR